MVWIGASSINVSVCVLVGLCGNCKLTRCGIGRFHSRVLRLWAAVAAFHIFRGGAIIMRVYLHSAFLEINSSDASIPNILVHY